MKDFIKEMAEKYQKLPELQCNQCGTIFKGDHKCDYEKLKEMNNELKYLCLWAARRLPNTHKQFAYDSYDRITGMKADREDDHE